MKHLLLLALVWSVCTRWVEAQPPACQAVAQLVNDPDFIASPQPHRDAEMLALWYSNGLVAEGSLYRELEADLESFVMSHPEVAMWEIRRINPEDHIIVTFLDADARDAAEAGENDAFNCLTELLDTSSMLFFEFLPAAVISFDGRYIIDRVTELFELIPEVERADPDVFIPAFDTGCFHSPDGYSRTYFFEEVSVIVPGTGILGQVLRVDYDQHGLVAFEEYDQRDEAPWVAEYEACLDRELSGELRLAVIEIPVLSNLGVVLLAGFLLFAGWWRLRSARS